MSTLTDPKLLVSSLLRKDLPGKNLQFLVDNQDGLDIQESGEGGCLNRIFIVRSSDGKNSVIIKHGTDVPKVKALSGLNLPIERQELEYECLKLLHSILPGCVPQPYHLDKELHMILMEDLGTMDLLSSHLRVGNIDMNIAAEIGRVIAQIQLKTHKKLVTPHTWSQYQARLRHAGVRDIALFIRTDSVLDGGLFLDEREEFMKQVKEWSIEIKETNIFEKFKELFNREDCFVHIDLHHHSIFVKEGRLVIFDLELGGLGNQAYALGYLFAFYIFSMVEVQEKPKLKREAIRNKTEHALHAMYSAFISGFGDTIGVLGSLTLFMQECSVFLGNTLYHFSLCKNHAMFFNVNPILRRQLAELGMELMRHPTKHNSIEELTKTIFSYV